MAGTTAWVLGDQLSLENPALDGAERVLMVESEAALRWKRWHRQKLHLLLVAMRSFADALRDRGVEVDYVRARSLSAGLRDHLARERPDRVRLMQPKNRAGRDRLGRLPSVEIVPDALFLTDPDAFGRWAARRRRLVMEDFYRWQRRRLDVLMDGEQPAGGRWNLDRENRSPAPEDAAPPPPPPIEEGAHDRAVRAELDAAGLDLWGEDGPRWWPATAEEAHGRLERFVADALPSFGTFQDAMLAGERTLWHSLLSGALNLGLIDPLRCVRAAEAAYRDGAAPLNSVEGFVRQIIGWREFVWCMYWHVGDEWGDANALGAHGPLPDVLETGETRMRCLSEAVGGLRRTAYAHHIERLMLFGNLVLLCGTEPRAALDWYHRAFLDGYEWVMAPNVVGMATFADGGRMMTKPYAASGRYVQRMSDLCGGCAYRPGDRVGERACPFTVLYWDFLARHRERLSENRRMEPVLRNLDRFDPGQVAELRARASQLREHFDA